MLHLITVDEIPSRTLEDYKHEFNMYIIEEFFEVIYDYNGSYKSAIHKQPREK